MIPYFLLLRQRMFSSCGYLRCLYTSATANRGWHQNSLTESFMSYLLLIVACLYNPRYIMYITLLSFVVQWHLFDGGYYYAHLGVACSGYTSAATVWGAARIRGNTVCSIQMPYSLTAQLETINLILWIELNLNSFMPAYLF